MSGYAPIYNSKQEFLGIVGADIRLTAYLERLQSIKNSLILGMTVAAFASLLTGVGVWYVRNAALQAEARNKEQQETMQRMEKERIESERLQKLDAEQKQRAELNKMADDFEQSVRNVVSSVVQASSQLRSSAENVSHVAEDSKQRAAAMADATIRTAQTSTQVSESAEELTASIGEISAQTQKTSSVAQEASDKAMRAREAIELLSARSDKVGAIVQVINDISGQINLLALNATIESARAGEAGKGFAVVANEVKQLAAQVNKATDEISSQISSMQGATQTSVESVMHILSTIQEVTSSVQAVAAAVEEQTAVTNEIARNITITSNEVQHISDNVQQVKQGSDSVGQTANKVLTAAIELNDHSSSLGAKVDEFLQRVRNT